MNMKLHQFNLERFFHTCPLYYRNRDGRSTMNGNGKVAHWSRRIWKGLLELYTDDRAQKKESFFVSPKFTLRYTLFRSRGLFPFSCCDFLHCVPHVFKDIADIRGCRSLRLGDFMFWEAAFKCSLLRRELRPIWPYFVIYSRFMIEWSWAVPLLIEYLFNEFKRWKQVFLAVGHRKKTGVSFESQSGPGKGGKNLEAPKPFYRIIWIDLGTGGLPSE